MQRTESAAYEMLLGVVRKQSDAQGRIPEGLAERILEHEHAVQFDEKRYEAVAYIRSLIVEELSSGEVAE
jgi:hypothetical protein